MDKSATENGQGLVEYALILILVVIVVVASLTIVGISVDDLYNGLATVLVDTFT